MGSRRIEDSDRRNRLLPAICRKKLRPVDAIGHKINSLVAILSTHNLLKPLRNYHFMQRQTIGGFTTLNWKIGKNLVTLYKIYLCSFVRT